jgi:hypothetical protein
MVSIPSISTTKVENEWSHLYISPVELATNSNLSIVLSWVMEFEIFLVF